MFKNKNKNIALFRNECILLSAHCFRSSRFGCYWIMLIYANFLNKDFKAMLGSESYLACLSMNHLFFKLIIKMQVFEHFLITGFISYAYCCHGNLHQQPKYITLRGNKYLRQIFSFRFLFFHPDIKIHLVSILSEGIFDKIFFLREK